MRINFLVDPLNAGYISGIQISAIRLAKELKERGIDVVIDGKDYNYDIVHTHTCYPQFNKYIIKIRKLNGAKIVVHAHTTVEDLNGSFTFTDSCLTRSILKYYLRYYYNRADIVIAPSLWAKECLIKTGVRKPVKVISNGIDISKFKYRKKKRNEFRKEHGLKANEKVVYTAGLVFLRKGLNDFKQVAKDMPDIKFLWVGKRQNLLLIKPVRMSLALKNMPDNVYFTGYVKDIVAAHCAGDVFFFPSYVENQGIAVLEACACKKPIIIRDIPVYKQWFKHSVNCYSGKTTSDFEKGIDKILSDRQFRTKITDGGFKVAKDNDITFSIDELINIYNHLVT